jgi:integrase
LINETVSDVLESHSTGHLSTSVLKNFFQQAAQLVEQPDYTRDALHSLMDRAVCEVALNAGQELPNSTVRDWCNRWLDSKQLESASRTHERYEVSLRRFLNFLGPLADRDLTALRPNHVVESRDATAKKLSPASANMDLKVIRACLYAAQRQDLIDTNVATKVSTIKLRSESKRRAFTLEEVRKVLSKCDELVANGVD